MGDLFLIDHLVIVVLAANVNTHFKQESGSVEFNYILILTIELLMHSKFIKKQVSIKRILRNSIAK